MSMMSPQVSGNDVQTLLKLAEFVAAPDFKGNLKALAEQKAEIDAAIKMQQEIRQVNDAVSATLGAGTAALKERTANLDKRETEFEESQGRAQNDIEQERWRLRDWHGAQNKSHADKAAELSSLQNALDGRYKELEQREKTLVKRELAAVEKDEKLIAREQAVASREVALEQRRKRIAEAAAEA